MTIISQSLDDIEVSSITIGDRKRIRWKRTIPVEQRLELIIDQLGGVPEESYFEDFRWFDSEFYSWFRSHREILAERRQEESRKIIETPSYTINELVGKGCWGDVYKARDNQTGFLCAIKVLNPTEVAREQMLERKLNPFEVMKNEAGIAECANVVPREFRIDEKGTPFIVMNYYERFLDDVLRDDKEIENRTRVGKGLEYETAKKYMLDIARGLAEMHRIRERVHGDLKPDNIALKRLGENNHRALISDLGTSTCGGFGGTLSPRDNIGFIYTRAPENFRKGKESHPKTQSDNFALASIIYRMFTGEYIFERELKENPDYLSEASQVEIESLTKRKLKKAKIPRSLKKVLGKNLSYDVWERDYDGKSMLEGLEKAVNDEDMGKFLLGIGKVAFLCVGLPILAASYAAYRTAIHEPLELSMPSAHDSRLWFDANRKLEDAISFESEEIKDLPEVVNNNKLGGYEVKGATQNRFAAYLLKCHLQAYQDSRNKVERDSERFPGKLDHTENQWEDYIAWGYAVNGSQGPGHMPFPGLPYIAWAKSIEASLVRAQNPDGKVDLEDVCAISRLGVNTVNKAKKSSKSFDYSVYRDAKNPKGEYIISRPEREFIDLWLSYIHAGWDKEDER